MRFKDELQRQIWYRSQIDYSYWMIQEISKHTGEMQSPIVAMVDKATGYDKVRLKENIKTVRRCIRTIINGKEKLGYDAEDDKRFLKELKKLIA